MPSRIVGMKPSHRLDEIRRENPDHMARFGAVSRWFFRLYFLIIRW